MKNVFLILGYGIPKNILKDENYNFYLKIVFNGIYNSVTKNNIERPFIICSGGKTDMFKPYKRTEAEEMVKLLKKISNRPFLKDLTKNWVFISEKKSLSTLENLLNCQAILQKKKIQKANFYIFCEQTRVNRVKNVSKKIFNKNYNFQVIPIDFDVSSNRYVDPEFLQKKEKVGLKYSLWALESLENLKKYNMLYQEKINYFRKVGPDVHVEVMNEWWEGKLKELIKILKKGK